jgi:hypothetical protein
MKTPNWLPGLIAIWLVLAGCGPRTYVTKDNSYDISKVRTYEWVRAQRDSIGRNRNPGTNDLTNNKIKMSMDNNLAAVGWQRARSNADVYLVYDVDVQRESRNVSDPVYSQPMTRWYYSPYRRGYVPVYYPSSLLGYNNSVETVNEGTITLTVIDAKTDKTIWQGSATSDINGRRMSDQEIDDYVKAIVKKLV